VLSHERCGHPELEPVQIVELKHARAPRTVRRLAQQRSTRGLDPRSSRVHIGSARHVDLQVETLPLEEEVRPIAMDVTDLASVEAVAREDDGPIDLLINSAGIMGQLDDAPGEVNYAEWARVMDVNTFGPVRVLDAFADRLAASGGAKAITLTSGMGSIGDVGSGYAMMYRVSKAGVNMAMRARALQLGPRGIVVAVINPGFVRTDMGGAGASISPEESVTAMRKVIDALTPVQTGAFLNWRGGEYPW
jgi:NAD(P)-dependent dehydrogenase (short-subunit alcohol dehydrogenase family)